MNKLINLLNRVIGNNGRMLRKRDEYMYWSPFVSHHKPKLQINVKHKSGIVGFVMKVDIKWVFSYAKWELPNISLKKYYNF